MTGNSTLRADPLPPLRPQSSFLADLGGGGGTIGVAGTEPGNGDAGNGTPTGPGLSPLTPLITLVCPPNILGGLVCPPAMLGVRECPPIILGGRECPNAGAPSPSPTPGVGGTEPGPNGAEDADAASGGGGPGVVEENGVYGYGLGGPNPPVAGVAGYGVPGPSTTHPLPCRTTRPVFTAVRWWRCPPAHLRLIPVDSAATIPGVESAPVTASMVRTVTRRKYEAQVKTPPMTPIHLMQLLSARRWKGGLYVPDEQLNQRGRALVDRDNHRIQVELEENARGAFVVT